MLNCPPPPKVKPPELSLFPLFPNSWKLHLCKFAKKRNEQILSSIFPTSPSSRGGQQRQKQNRRTWLHSHSHTHSQSSRPATRRAKIASSLLLQGRADSYTKGFRRELSVRFQRVSIVNRTSRNKKRSKNPPSTRNSTRKQRC